MNTSRMNRLEELGRVDAEKAYTKKGKANLSDEKARIVREVSMDKGGKVYNYKDGGSVMGRGQGKVMRNKPTYIISMKD